MGEGEENQTNVHRGVSKKKKKKICSELLRTEI